MRTITFYSYKGGVGRTLAAANFGAYLARLGQRVVLLDFDLEAPGMDSKFQPFELPKGQRGILQHILDFQRSGKPPRTIEDILVPLPEQLAAETGSLWLIPAGDYLSPQYYRDLNALNWGEVFSAHRDGVAFFQNFLHQVEYEMGADFLIVDSRTGISEISGLCTQQLADEVVMFTSLSSESIKVTKSVMARVKESKIAEELGKSIHVKVVISRVPKPDDLDALKKRCSAAMGIDESALSFLFSCPALEEREFLAIVNPSEEEELVANYVRLFYALNIELASSNIETEIDKVKSQVWSVPPDQAEKEISELAGLYPHPEVYRTAMRFFRIRDNTPQVRSFALKVLDLVPHDQEAAITLVESYPEGALSDDDARQAVRAMRTPWERGDLTASQAVRYADILEDMDEDQRSHEVAMATMAKEGLSADLMQTARAIAARTADQLGDHDTVASLLRNVPEEELTPRLAVIAAGVLERRDGIQAAYESLLRRISYDISMNVLREAARLARQLGRIDELESTVRASGDFRNLSRRRSSRVVEQELHEAGLGSLALEIGRTSGR